MCNNILLDWSHFGWERPFSLGPWYFLLLVMRGSWHHQPWNDHKVTEKFKHMFMIYLWIDHVFLVGLFWLRDALDGHVRCEDVPCAISGQHETTVLENVQVKNVEIRVGRNNEDVVLSIVAPKVAQGTSHGKEWDLVDWGWPSHWALQRSTLYEKYFYF